MSHFSETLVRILYPQSNECHVCERYIDQGMLCSTCYQELQSLRLPCQWERMPKGNGYHAAVFRYKGPARELIHMLKYRSDYIVAQFLGESLCTALLQQPSPPLDVVIPVPLHRKREKKRGYNQSEWLAKELAAHLPLTVCTEALTRTSFSISQIFRNRSERFAATKGAFGVAKPEAVIGKHILLIDDVFTTGATASSCIQALMQAGAKDVYVLTVCRA